MKVLLTTGLSDREDVKKAIQEVAPLISKFAEYPLVDKGGTEDLSKLQADLIILLGGDGSMINVAKRLNGNQIPVLGVNFGKFGFLAEYEYNEFLTDIEEVLKGGFKISKRMLLQVSGMRDSKEFISDLALNDVVISRSHFSRIIQVELEVNGQFCTDYHVDGLIISTPSGSTAHSLGAGGPILQPNMDATIITPICPHTMSVRPLVVPGNFPLKLTLRAKSDTVAATIDGQKMHELTVGDAINITNSDKRFHLVVSGRRTFYERLHMKLNWSGHSNLKQK